MMVNSNPHISNYYSNYSNKKYVFFETDERTCFYDNQKSDQPAHDQSNELHDQIMCGVVLELEDHVFVVACVLQQPFYQALFVVFGFVTCRSEVYEEVRKDSYDVIVM